MIEKIKANPYYVSSLLGPLALAVAKDDANELLSSIDYSSQKQSALVIECLIKPTFERLQDSTQEEVAKALAYFSSQPNAASDIIESKLLLCEVPPVHHFSFLGAMWDVLFFKQSATDVAAKVNKIANRPLTMRDFLFQKNPSNTLDELIEELRDKIRG